MEAKGDVEKSKIRDAVVAMLLNVLQHDGGCSGITGISGETRIRSLGIGSLLLLELMETLERALEVRIPNEGLWKVTTVDDLVELVAASPRSPPRLGGASGEGEST